MFQFVESIECVDTRNRRVSSFGPSLFGRPSRRLLAAGIVFAVGLGSLGHASTTESGQQGGRFQFKVDVNAVSLSVVVTDKKGRFIPNLTMDDFEVREDNVVQEPSFFQSEVTPVTVLLLLDASTSIRPSVEGVKEAASNFVTKLWDGDQAIIADFNESIRFSSHFTDDADRLVATIQSLYPAGWTALYDSVLISIDKVMSEPGRKALLVFTDGDDSRSLGQGSEADSNDVLEGARLSEVSIYSVGFEGRGNRGRGVNKGFLRKLARQTGGEAFFPKGIGDLNKAFSRIQEELHSQYRMAYVSTNSSSNGAWREIALKVKNRDDLIVRTRQGYYPYE